MFANVYYTFEKSTCLYISDFPIHQQFIFYTFRFSSPNFDLKHIYLSREDLQLVGLFTFLNTMHHSGYFYLLWFEKQISHFSETCRKFKNYFRPLNVTLKIFQLRRPSIYSCDLDNAPLRIFLSGLDQKLECTTQTTQSTQTTQKRKLLQLIRSDVSLVGMLGRGVDHCKTKTMHHSQSLDRVQLISFVAVAAFCMRAPRFNVANGIVLKAEGYVYVMIDECREVE